MHGQLEFMGVQQLYMNYLISTNQKDYQSIYFDLETSYSIKILFYSIVIIKQQRFCLNQNLYPLLRYYLKEFKSHLLIKLVHQHLFSYYQVLDLILFLKCYYSIFILVRLRFSSFQFIAYLTFCLEKRQNFDVLFIEMLHRFIYLRIQSFL